MRRILLLVALLLVTVRATGATDLRNVITDVAITSWNEKDGLPSATIWALGQDADGYLWVGTREGLLRFDGVRFSQWEVFSPDPLPHLPVRALLVSKSGAMWVGFGVDGQIARVVNGRVSLFTGHEGLGRGAVLGIAEDADGVVWAAGDAGLSAFDGTRWNQWSEARGLPAGPVFGVYVDRGGSVYAAAGTSIFVRRRGDDRFERTSRFGDTLGGFAETPDGTVWFTDPTVGYRSFASSPGATLVPRQGRGVRMVVDRKGSLWVGTGGQGLWRARNAGGSAPSLERATSLSGLLGDGVYSLLEDRDGNIWAGTTEGLNRLTPRTIEQIIDIGLARGVAMEPDGSVWIRTVDKLFSYLPIATGLRREIPIPADAGAMAIDDHGLWVAEAHRLFRVDRLGNASRVPWPLERQAGAIQSIQLDRQGGLWLVTAEHGIVHWRGGDVRRPTLPDAVRDAHVTAALVDTSGRAWFAFDNGGVAHIGADEHAVLPIAPGPRAPVYTVLHEADDGGLWLGGNGALSRFDNGRIATVQATDRFPIQSIMSLVSDRSGALWIGSPTGVLQVERDEFDRAVATPGAQPRHSLYTRSDGIAGTPVAVGLSHGAVRALDGRLWFVTTRGVTVLDPHVLEAHGAPAPLRFEGALADDRRFRPGTAMRLPAGTRKLEIDYTAVNLTAPLKARFRYRLDPFDQDWVAAGTRRQAFYTNLRPGRYVFRAVVEDGAGGVSASEAAWELAVAPMFYQTATFWAIAGLSACVLLFAGWQLRERHLRKQFSLIISERARLGREIHDTLLQGLVAIALQFDSLAHDLGPTPRLQARFLRLRDRIEEYIREARRSIWDLHTQPAHRNLVESLRRAGEFATDGREIAFSLQVQGTPYPCPPQVEEQVVRIAQEAALNSVRHASPRRLRIDLHYEESAVTLKVADDGRGFDSGEAKGACHFGIASMYDRAQSVGGALTLVTSPGRGTEITAVLPVAS